MKRVLSIVLSVIVIAVSFSIIVSAEYDSVTGVEYEMIAGNGTLHLNGGKIIYHHEVSGVDESVGGQSPVDVFNYRGNESDKEFQDKKEEYRQELIRWAEGVATPDESVVSCTLYDDNYRPMQDSVYTRLIIKYFGLTQKFKGIKRVTKEGIPFVITGDGTGNYILDVDESVKGMHRKIIKIPAERDYTIYYKVLNEKYYFTYTQIANGRTTGTTFSSLQEGLEFCKANADLTKSIKVCPSFESKMYLEGTITCALQLDITYGTSNEAENMMPSKDDNENKKPITPPKENDAVVTDSVEKHTVDEVETDLEISTDDVTSTSLTNDNGTVDTTNSNIVEKEEKISQKSKIIVSGLCVVGIAAMGVGGFVILKKNNVLKNKK